MIDSILMFVLGTIAASFIGLIFDRRKKDDHHLRSHCENCQHTLAPWDLIPLLSFLFLRGHCRYCQAAIRPEHLLRESLGGLLFLGLYLHLGREPALALLLLMSIPMAFLALDDAAHRWVHDKDQLFLLTFVLIYLVIFDCPSFPARLYALALFGGGTLLLARLWPNALGSGDVLFIAIMAFHGGIWIFPAQFLLGTASALIWTVFTGYKSRCVRTRQIPLVTFLVLSIWLDWCLDFNRLFY